MEKRLYFRERGLELRKVYNLEKGVYSGERSLILKAPVSEKGLSAAQPSVTDV